MQETLSALLSELRSSFERLYDQRLARLILFGSQARADAEPGSDIDVLVVLHDQVKPGEEIARTGPITAALSLKYDAIVSCTFIAADRFATEQSPLLLNVHREGVMV